MALLLHTKSDMTLASWVYRNGHLWEDEEWDEEEEEPVDESGQGLCSHVPVAVLLIGPPLPQVIKYNFGTN